MRSHQLVPTTMHKVNATKKTVSMLDATGIFKDTYTKTSTQSVPPVTSTVGGPIGRAAILISCSFHMLMKTALSMLAANVPRVATPAHHNVRS